MQLDLFAHGRDVVLRNAVFTALQERDAGAAEAALGALRGERPDDGLLGPGRVLATALAEAVEPFATHGQAAEALRRMEGEVVPAAHRLFDAPEARAWMAPLWRSLARAARNLPYDRDFPEVHAAPLLLRSGDWTAAAERAAAVASWRRMPRPLAWMLEARFGEAGLEAAWALMAELAWIEPAGFGALAPRLQCAPLDRLLEDFETGFQPSEAAALAWFPAWALVAQPGLAQPFREARACSAAPPERAARLVAELLNLERHGRHHELVAGRKRLRDLHPLVFARYMATR
ncbi:MAG: hypothetical protein ACT4P4_13240 [Betaproteobacteria bacterium]